MLCYAALCCAVLCCAVLCCAVLCCAVLCCVALFCAVLCCAVLCRAVLSLCCAWPAMLCFADQYECHSNVLEPYSVVSIIIVCAQVEDMLKRSFAEFHAQRSHPEALQKLAEGKARLDALKAKPWPHSPHATSQQHVQEYYHLSEHIRALTTHIQVGHPSFMTGR